MKEHTPKASQLLFIIVTKSHPKISKKIVNNVVFLERDIVGGKNKTIVQFKLMYLSLEKSPYKI